MNERFNNMTNKQKFQIDGDELMTWDAKALTALTMCNYKQDDDNEEAIGEMVFQIAEAMCWICRSPEENINYTTPKSFMIFGTPGAGKTYFFEILSNRFNSIQMIGVDRIDQQEPKRFGFWTWYAQWDDLHLVIDDVGAEINTQAIIDIIKHREKLWKNNGILTFYTSNLKNRDELEAKYGTRIKSRILGQCNTIKLTGPDRRLT